MSYEVKYTSRFKRDYKRMQRRGKDVQKLLDVIDMLREGQTLPPRFPRLTPYFLRAMFIDTILYTLMPALPEKRKPIRSHA